MNHRMATCLVAMATSCLAQGPGASRARMDSVLAAARKDLPAFLRMIPPGQEKRHGFEDRSQFARAGVGAPIPVFTVEATLADSLSALADPGRDRPVPTGSWRVPVLVDGQPKTLLTVERMGGVWQGVEIGGASLGRELHVLDSAHPGKRKGLLRMDRLGGDILLLDSAEGDFAQARCLPLRSFHKALPGDSAGARSGKDMFRSLRRAMQERKLREGTTTRTGEERP